MPAMTRCGNQSRAFYVVQFIELPFEGIDDYVCVPNNWLIVRRARDQKAAVKYPKHEDPFDTRDRAKRKERFDDEWRSFMAAVKYESDTYWDAEFWIATRNDYGPLVEEGSKIIETQPRLTINKKLSSANQSRSSKSINDPRKPLQIQPIKRPALSEPKKQLDGKRLKLNEAAQSSRADVNNAYAEPGCSRWDQSIIIQENQSTECRQTDETAAASNGVSSSSQRRNGNLQDSTPMHEQQELNMPLMDVDVPTIVCNDNEEIQPTTILENQLFSIQVLSQLAKQSELLQEPPISVASSMEMTCNDNTNNALKSLKMTAHLYTHMNGARCLVPIGKPVEKKLRPMNIREKLVNTAQDPSNLMKENSSTNTQNSLQDVPRDQKMRTANCRSKKARLRSMSIAFEKILRYLTEIREDRMS